MKDQSLRDRITLFLLGCDLQERNGRVYVYARDGNKWRELGSVSADFVAQDPEGARKAIARIQRHHITTPTPGDPE